MLNRYMDARVSVGLSIDLAISALSPDVVLGLLALQQGLLKVYLTLSLVAVSIREK